MPVYRKVLPQGYHQEINSMLCAIRWHYFKAVNWNSLNNYWVIKISHFPSSPCIMLVLGLQKYVCPLSTNELMDFFLHHASCCVSQTNNWGEISVNTTTWLYNQLIFRLKFLLLLLLFYYYHIVLDAAACTWGTLKNAAVHNHSQYMKEITSDPIILTIIF
jgi:hypothetical protein